MATLIVNDVDPRIQYTASGGQTNFTYPFAIFADADLKVYLTPVGQTADDDVDLLTLTTNYTVTGAGTTAGGDAVLVVAATAGDIVTIVRDLPVKRTTDFQTAGDFLAATMNDELDKAIMMIQQNESLLARTMTLTETDSSGASLKIPVGALQFVRWNAAGTALELVTIDPLSSITNPFATNGIQFPLSGSVLGHSEGLITYDFNEKTFICYIDETEITLNLGEEQWLRARNTTGSTVTNGQVVYISGATGNKPLISLAKSDARATAELIGIATHDIENNSFGIVTVFGLVRDVDTSSFSAGDQLYVSPSTAGLLTSTKPTGTDYPVRVATVVNDHATQGILLVNPYTPLDITDIANFAFAVKADQETGTSLVLGVAPGTQHNHPSANKASAIFDGTGTPAMLATAYGFSATVADDGTGAYTLTLSTGMSASPFPAHGTLSDANPPTALNPERTIKVVAASTTTVKILTSTSLGTATDTAFISITVQGDQ